MIDGDELAGDRFLQPGQIRDALGRLEEHPWLVPFLPPEEEEKFRNQPIRQVIEEEKQRLALTEQARREHEAEKEAASLTGRLTPDAEQYYELAIKGQVGEAHDFNPTQKIPVVQGLVERNTVNWVAAGSGSFKSFVSADLAFRYGSDDMDYYGRKMTHGRALIVLAEGASGYAYRKRAWEKHHDREVKNVSFLPHAVQLGQPHQVAALCHYLRQENEAGRPFDMVIIDTQAMSTVGVDENGAEMNAVIAQLGRIRDVNGACVLVVHHFGKDKKAGMRGSSMLYAAADTIIVTQRDANSPMLVTLSTAPGDGGKQKDLQSESDIVTLELVSHQVDTDYFGDPVSSLVPVEAGTPAAVPDADTPPAPESLPEVTEKQMGFLKALNYFEGKGASPSGVALHMNEEAGHKITYQQLVRNAFIGLGKAGLVEQPNPKGPWFITPLGVSVIARDMADRVRLEDSWVQRAPSRRRGKHPVDPGQEEVSGLVSGDDRKPPAETSETSAKPPAKLALTSDETSTPENET